MPAAVRMAAASQIGIAMVRERRQPPDALRLVGGSFLRQIGGDALQHLDELLGRVDQRLVPLHLDGERQPTAGADPEDFRAIG